MATRTPSRSLFDPVQAGALALPSRVVMAPLTRNRAPGAVPTALMATYYSQRANPKNGAALIITEATAITHQAQGYADVPGLYAPEQIAAWRVVTDAVHAAGGKIVVQLWHVGRVSHVDLQPGGQAPVAPSAIAAKTKTVLITDGVPRFVATSEPRALRLDELPGIVADYRRAALAAIEAGFDGVEVHAANGYLLDQFLRSNSNLRTDAYGGSVDNRARLLLEVMQAITHAIGGARAGIRLSPVTPANDVFDAHPQALFDHVARHLGPMGLAYVHVIEGSTGGPRDHTQGEAPFDYAAMRQAWRDGENTAAVGAGKAKTPPGAWMVNNGLDHALAQAQLDSGADLVAVGKLFIANPDLARRWRENAPLNAPDKTTFYGGGAKGYTDYPTLDEATNA